MSNALLARIDDLRAADAQLTAGRDAASAARYNAALADYAEALTLAPAGAQRDALCAFLGEALDKALDALDVCDSDGVAPLLRIFAAADAALLARAAGALLAQARSRAALQRAVPLLLGCNEVFCALLARAAAECGALDADAAAHLLECLDANCEALDELAAEDAKLEDALHAFADALFQSALFPGAAAVVSALSPYHVALLRAPLGSALRLRDHYLAQKVRCSVGERLVLLNLLHLLHECERGAAAAPLDLFGELLELLSPELFLWEERALFFELLEARFAALDRAQAAQLFLACAETATQVSSHNALLLLACLQEICARHRELVLELLYAGVPSAALGALRAHHCAAVASAATGVLEAVALKRSPAEVRRELHSRYGKTCRQVVKALARKSAKALKKLRGAAAE